MINPMKNKMNSYYSNTSGRVKFEDIPTNEVYCLKLSFETNGMSLLRIS